METMFSQTKYQKNFCSTEEKSKQHFSKSLSVHVTKNDLNFSMSDKFKTLTLLHNFGVKLFDSLYQVNIGQKHFIFTQVSLRIISSMLNSGCALLFTHFDIDACQFFGTDKIIHPFSHLQI